MAEFVWSYTSGTSSRPLLGMTIGDCFEEIAARFPDRDAVISRHQNTRLSYGELRRLARQCARGLIALGFRKGDRLGIWSPNCAEWTVTQLATAYAGIVLVNINPNYRVHELEYVLRQSGCSGLLVSEVFRSSDYPGMVAQLIPELELGSDFSSARLASIKAVVSLGASTRPGIKAWGDLLARGDEISEETLDAMLAETQFDDPINIQYTSGTTGFPKGATLSHHNILNNGYFVAELMNFTEQDRLVIPVPLYHCFGMVMANLGCITHGAAMIYPSPIFDPAAVLQAVQEEKATALYGVPTMFIAELEHPDFGKYDLTSLRTGIMAGAPCPVEVMKKVNTLMHMSEVEIAYGMTETSPVSFQTRADAPLDKRVSTVGQVHPHVEVKIVDPVTGKILKTGENGELCTRGYSVMLGYWENPEATAKSIDEAGWMHTGDLAVMDSEGYVNIVGRIKDMIIRGGENIYPREVEEYLYTNGKVADVQVIGVPDRKYGEEVMAWIKLRPGVEMSEEEVKEFCRGRIAHYKVPRYVKFVDGFPMTVTGKIQKFVMREESVRELGLEGPEKTA